MSKGIENKRDLENKRVNTVIIGGGISGLSLGFLLKKRGVDVLVLEAKKWPGGKMDTLREQGFIMEKGPNGFLDSKPHTLRLIDELEAHEFVLPSSDKAKERYLFSRGKLRKIPMSPVGFLFSGIMPFGERLRVFAEPFIKARIVEDESVAEFVDRRLGVGARKRLITPMVSGIFAGDPEKLSMPAAFGVLAELERKYGSLTKGMLKRPKKKGGGPSGPSGRLVSFKQGVKTLIEQLVRKLDNNVITDTLVREVKREEYGYRVVFTRDDVEKSVQAKNIVLATPAYVSAGLIKGVDQEIGSLLARIEYAPLSVIATGFKRDDVPHRLGGFGYLIPPVEGCRVLGTLWDSEVFVDRAPEGMVLMRTMIGGAMFEELALKNDEELIDMALKSLNKIMGIEAKPVIVRVFKHNKAIPQFNVGYLKLKREIQALLDRHTGLYLCNNSWWGVGLNDCTRGAFEVADKIFDKEGIKKE